LILVSLVIFLNDILFYDDDDKFLCTFEPCVYGYSEKLNEKTRRLRKYKEQGNSACTFRVEVQYLPLVVLISSYVKVFIACNSFYNAQ
jgi:hypothetical protein